MKRIAEWMGRFAGAVSITDLHLYGGIVAIAIGAEKVWPGLGFLAAGAALFWLAVRKVEK